MQFNEAIKMRRSIRAFKEVEITEQMLHDILNAAILAPSAGNLQAYEMYVATDKNILRKLAEAAGQQNFIIEAPVAIIFCANMELSASRYGKRGSELYSIQDATIAAAYLQLAATDIGLATVWVGAFNEKEVKAIMHFPPHLRPVAIIPVGYPNEEPSSTPRRSFNDIVHKSS